jgi:hypothetical protein
MADEYRLRENITRHVIRHAGETLLSSVRLVQNNAVEANRDLGLRGKTADHRADGSPYIAARPLCRLRLTTLRPGREKA